MDYDQDGWIPTKHRLPNIGDRFDAWIDGRRIADHGAYIGSWTDDDRRSTMLMKGITHWRPIPSAPKYDHKECENKIGGSCPLHNLHCSFPRCTMVLLDDRRING